jgi:hypothetical protein
MGPVHTTQARCEEFLEQQIFSGTVLALILTLKFMRVLK